MADIRAHHATGTIAEFRKEFIANYRPSRRVMEARTVARLAEEAR